MRVKEENVLIDRIAQRAVLVYAQYGTTIPYQYVASELKIVHREICELRLQDLLDTDEFNFMHDITGIHKHIDILDGSFKDQFIPRFAKV